MKAALHISGHIRRWNGSHIATWMPPVTLTGSQLHLDNNYTVYTAGYSSPGTQNSNNLCGNAAVSVSYSAVYPF